MTGRLELFGDGQEPLLMQFDASITFKYKANYVIHAFFRSAACCCRLIECAKREGIPATHI